MAATQEGKHPALIKRHLRQPPGHLPCPKQAKRNHDARVPWRIRCSDTPATSSRGWVLPRGQSRCKRRSRSSSAETSKWMSRQLLTSQAHQQAIAQTARGLGCATSWLLTGPPAGLLIAIGIGNAASEVIHSKLPRRLLAQNRTISCGGVRSTRPCTADMAAA